MLNVEFWMLNIDMVKSACTIALTVILALTSVLASATNITASVNRNPVTIDESFSLILQADGEIDSEPDLSPLKKDFDILGTSQSTSMNFINGTISHKSTWTIDLMSKDVGVLTIPSIAFGKDRSPSLRITVKDSQNGGAQVMADQPIRIEVSTDKQQVWQQAQLVLTVKLFHKTGISNASLSEVETSDPYAIVEQLGEDSNYDMVHNGVRYGVIERKYAIFPQRSGTLTISPMRFEARVGNIRRDFFGTFGGGALKRVRSKAVEVEVRPMPANIGASQWLPAKKVLIKQEWSQPLDKLRAGEPVTRTLTLVARGILASQLPDIPLPEVKDVKQYPDKPVLNSRTDGSDVVSSKQIKIALIPAYAGRYTLPEIRLPWWNTKTGKTEYAILPAQSLIVQGESRTADDGGRSEAPTSEQETTQSDSEMPASHVTDRGFDDTEALRFWQILSAVLAAGWILSLLWFVRRAPRSHSNSASPRQLKREAIARCRQNDARACKNALLQWAQAQWPQHHIGNLIDIATQVDDGTADAIRELNAALYSQHAEQWRGDRLADALQTLRPASDATGEPADAVEPLHKIR